MIKRNGYYSKGFCWTVFAVAAGILTAAGIAALIWKFVLRKRGFCCGCNDEDMDEFEDWDEFDEVCDCGVPEDPDADDDGAE